MRKIILVLIATFFVTPAWGFTEINCDSESPPNSIQEVLNSGETEIFFVGVCDEYVSIDGADSVKLSGVNKFDSVITGSLDVVGVSDLKLENLKFGGGSYIAMYGSYVQIKSVSVQVDKSFFVGGNSAVYIDDSDLSNEGKQEDCGIICVADSSSVTIKNSTITSDIDDSSIGPTVEAFRHSSINLRGGNVVTNNGSVEALGAFHGSHIRVDNTVGKTNKINGGIYSYGQSFVDIRDATVTGPSIVELHSVLRITGSSKFDGDIRVLKDSALDISNSKVSIKGTVTCEDKESSLNTQKFKGKHTIDCTDYNN